MNKKNIIIIILAILLIASLIYFWLYPMIYNSIYSKGLLDGQLSVIQSIGNSGNIPIINNGTIQIIHISDICGRLK